MAWGQMRSSAGAGKWEKGGTFAFANNAPWTIIEI